MGTRGEWGKQIARGQRGKNGQFPYELNPDIVRDRYRAYPLEIRGYPASHGNWGVKQLARGQRERNSQFPYGLNPIIVRDRHRAYPLKIRGYPASHVSLGGGASS